MVDDRLRLGSLITAVGAALLGLSVFLPWYAVSLTAGGASSAQQTLNSVAQQYGNAALQAQAKTLGAGFGAFAGHQVATLSAHQVLKYLNVVLLVLATIALLAALFRLAGTSEPGGRQIALVGAMATLCVLFRMVERPAPQEGVFSLSLGWGIWLALGSSVAIVVGALCSMRASATPGSPAAVAGAWEQFSGWTPET